MRIWLRFEPVTLRRKPVLLDAGGRGLAREAAELPHDPDADNYLVDDMALFNAFAVGAARALPPDPADDLEDA
jgi:hypothetical protein